VRKSYQSAVVFLILAAIAYFTNSSWIEIVASVSGLFSVWLAVKENIWYYPVGLVNIITFAYIFYGVKLYADFTLQIVFFILSVYGWWIWLTKREGRPVRPTTSLSRAGWIVLTVVVPINSFIWGMLLTRFTDASIPHLDTFVATLSMAAQYLLSRKIIQNWYLWITVDVLSVGMYWYKELYTISFTYFVFLIICISGLISWKRSFGTLASVHEQSELHN
jgi:nicotinamide mononucleotide transporter